VDGPRTRGGGEVSCEGPLRVVITGKLDLTILLLLYRDKPKSKLKKLEEAKAASA
jgi:hypothetical protein